jgi:hypothetical protein
MPASPTGSCRALSGSELRVAELGQKIYFLILRLTLDSRLAKPRFDNKTAHGITDDRLFHISCAQDLLCSSKPSNQGRRGERSARSPARHRAKQMWRSIAGALLRGMK